MYFPRPEFRPLPGPCASENRVIIFKRHIDRTFSGIVSKDSTTLLVNKIQLLRPSCRLTSDFNSSDRGRRWIAVPQTVTCSRQQLSWLRIHVYEFEDRSSILLVHFFAPTIRSSNSHRCLRLMPAQLTWNPLGYCVAPFRPHPVQWLRLHENTQVCVKSNRAKDRKKRSRVPSKIYRVRCV